jgi:hypothetical protein
MSRPLGLSDAQVQSLLEVGSSIPIPKRQDFLERLAAHLRLNANRPPSEEEFRIAVDSALQGLQQHAAVHVAGSEVR